MRLYNARMCLSLHSVAPCILVSFVVKPLYIVLRQWRCPHNDVAVVATAVQFLLVAVVATAVNCVQVTSQSAKILTSQAVQALDDAS